MRDNLNRGNNMRETLEASPSVTPIRRDYATPMLAVYGNLADLTATGSGSWCRMVPGARDMISTRSPR